MSTDPLPPPASPTAPPPLALRALYMLVFAIVFWILTWILAVTALLQLLLTALATQPNAELARFGRALAHYCGQVVEFLTFASERVPFPFSDWPLP